MKSVRLYRFVALIGLVTGLAVFASACSLPFQKKASNVSITGNVVTKVVSLSETIAQVTASGGAIVTLIDAPVTKLEVTTDDGFFPRVQSSVEDGVLRLGTVYAEDNISAQVSFVLETDFKRLEGLRASGGSLLSLEDKLELPILTFRASGGGNLVLSDVSTNEVIFKSSGGGKISLDNLSTSVLRVENSGGAIVEVKGNCEATKALLELGGGGRFIPRGCGI